MLKIRQENSSDYPAVFQVVKSAFADMEMSDQTEHFLVERLRKTDAFIPELSLVAEQNGEIVGHIILTKITIENEQQIFPSLALAPVSVKPMHQNKGIGGQLIQEAHRIAKELQYASIILLGHPHYYPRFGYELCSKYGITMPFEAPDESCMVLELTENGLQGVSGIVVYSQAFFE